MSTHHAKLMESKPDRIRVTDLVVSFNEMLGDAVIYTPWADDEYITQIGDYTVGLSESPYLSGALDKVRTVYGEEIGTGLIDSRPIPRITEPMIRRHGGEEHRLPLNKFLIYKDASMPEFAEVFSADFNTTNQAMLKSIGVTQGLPQEPDMLPPEASYIRGVTYINPVKERMEVLIQEEHNISKETSASLKQRLIRNYEEEPAGHLTIMHPARRRIKVVIINPPMDESREIYIENKKPYSADWEQFTGGDENTNRNVNEPELWRPIKQNLTPY